MYVMQRTDVAIRTLLAFSEGSLGDGRASLLDHPPRHAPPRPLQANAYEVQVNVQSNAQGRASEITIRLVYPGEEDDEGQGGVGNADGADDQDQANGSVNALYGGHFKTQLDRWLECPDYGEQRKVHAPPCTMCAHSSSSLYVADYQKMAGQRSWPFIFLW
jgi:hypothetical protein